MKNPSCRFSIKRMSIAFFAAVLLTGPLLVSGRAAHAQLEEKLQTQFDLFVGKNNTGPYTLSWNHILISHDVPIDVMVDGQTLKPDAFSVDAVKGIITFTRILSDKSIARVTYSYDLKISARNPNPTTTPVAVPVALLGQNTLSLIAVPGGAGSASGVPPVLLGLGGKTRLFGGGLTSDLKVGRENKASVRLAYSEGNDRNGVDAQYARIDKGFATAYGSALGMGDATQRVTLATRLAPSKYLRTSYSQNDTINLLTDERKGQNVYAVGLGGVGNMPTLNFNRTEDSALSPAKMETNVTTDKVDLSARLDKLTSVKATSVDQMVVATDPNAIAATKDNTITLTSSANGGVKQATATVNSTNKETNALREEKLGVSVRLQPAPIFIVSAGQSEQKDKTLAGDGSWGQTTVVTQTAGAEIAPMPGTRITSNLLESTTNDLKSTVASFGAQVGAGKKVELSTGVTNRSAEGVSRSPLDTTMARIALRPLKTLTFTGGYVWNPEDNGTVRQELRQDIGLSAKLGCIDLGSNYTLTTLNGIATEQPSNPQFGLVSLSMGFQFSRYTRLTGTYRDALGYRSLAEIDPSLYPQYMRSYGLGLTHNVGSALNVSLGGTLTEDRSKGNVPADVKGEAKIGIHF